MIIMIISLFKILGDFFSFFACVFVRFFFFLSFKKIKIEQNCPKLKRKNFNAQSALFTIISYVKNQYVAISQIFLRVFSSKISTLQFPRLFCEFFFVNNQNIAISQIFFEFFWQLKRLLRTKNKCL